MRGRTKAALVAAAAVVAAGAVIVPTLQPDAQADEAGAAAATAVVSRGDLTAAELRRGQVEYQDADRVAATRSGVLTSVAPSGSSVARGGELYRIDETPTILLTGQVPAFRALQIGSEGRDVRQLEENLQALGYGGFEVDETYTAGTAGAVARWQRSVGLDDTGEVALGTVVFRPSEVRVGAAASAIGDLIPAGGAVIEVSGADRVVVVELEETDLDLAVTGAAVQLRLASGAQPGTITDVTAVSVPGAQGAAATTRYQVTITVGLQARDAVSALPIGAGLDVGFGAQSAVGVLHVPVKALLALAEGGFGVEVLEDSATQLVPVTTGLFADGQVEISGSGIEAGDTVVVAP
jgi:peptidoglycan hydrolase-like protein with peptidoglycan-binding domain